MQVFGTWPLGHPLPLPRWAEHQKPLLHLQNLMEFEELASCIELHLQKLLEEHNYNTVGNFLSLYKAWNNSKSFADFFQSYVPPITPQHHTCVGLALELWHRLRQLLHKSFPNLENYLYIVSCEENIEYLNKYTSLSDRLDTAGYTLEKEHVLLCLRFTIAGRQGVLLCDPGYHVARVVTIMLDKAYPNTGWFIQSEESKIRKEYNYKISPLNENFVEWDERTTRNGVQEIFTGLVYIAKPYLTAVDVTERRNLVYNFRSLLSRDQKGHLIAGLYFKVKLNQDEFTIFYQDMGKQRVKMSFSSFLQPVVQEDLMKKVSICNEQLNLKEGELFNTIKDVGKLLKDRNYLQQLIDVDCCINMLSANN